MADLKRTVEIIFEGVDKTGDAMKGIGASLERFNSEVSGAVDPLAGIGKGILAADAALVALAAGGLTIATKAAGDFEAQFNTLTTLFEATPEQIAGFREEIKAYASDSSFSLEQIGAALEFAIGSGVKYSDSLGVLRQAEQIAIGGNAELDASLKLLVSSMNAYGAGTDEAQRYADAFFVTVRNGVITMPELAAQLADVTGIAATGNIPIETLGAAIAALTSAGLQAPQAMTALKAAIIALSAPSAETKSAAAALGVEIGSAAIESKGFENVLKELYTAADGNVEVLRRIIPNVESIAGVMILGADKSGAFSKALEDMANKTGATTAAYQKMADNIGLINQQMVNNIKLLLVEVGERLVGGYTGIATGISDIFKVLATELQAGTFDQIIKTIQELAGKMALELQKLAANLPAALKGVDFSALIASLQALAGSASTALSAIFGGVDLSTADGLRAAIQKIIDALTVFINISSGVVQGITPLIWAVESLIDIFSSLPDGIQESVGMVIGFSVALQAAILPLEGLALALSAAGASMGVFASAGTGIAAMFGSVTAGAAGTAAAIAGLAAAIAGAVAAGGALGVYLDNHSSKYHTLINAVSEYGARLLGGVSMEEEANKIRQAGTNLTTEQIEAFRRRNAEIAATPKEVSTKLTVTADKASVDKSKSELIEYMVDGKTRYMTIPVAPEVDKAKLSEARKKVEDELALKRYQVEVEADIKKFQAQADIIQAAMKFKAEVDIAGIVANAKIVESLAQGITKVFETSSNVINTTLGVLNTADSGSWKYYKLLDIIDQELRMKREALELQRKLNDSQTAYMDAKTKALNRGDATIKINADGLQPEIEAFMWKILDKIQLRAAAEQAEFLLGIPA